MKVLITTAAFALLTAGPALAQSYNPEVGSGNIVPPVIASGPGSTPMASFANVGHGSPAMVRSRHRGHAGRFIQRRQHGRSGKGGW
jgi:hypothetical protein